MTGKKKKISMLQKKLLKRFPSIQALCMQELSLTVRTDKEALTE